MKIKYLIIALALGITLLGCRSENAEQRKAYDAAYQTEQQYAITAGMAGPIIIQQYQAVIKIDPNSDLAKQAQQRIDIATKNWNDYRSRSNRFD